MKSDEQLINGCKNGDRLAQRMLYDKYSRKMFGVCLRYCDKKEEAEEILQEGLLKVFQKINDFRGDGGLEGWIRKIIVNTALDHYRKNKNKIVEEDLKDSESTGVEPNMELRIKDLLGIIRQLPTGFRTVFNLYAIEGYNHAEIGKLLNISEGTSKSQYSRARSYLIKMIEKENQGAEKKTGFEINTLINLI